MSPAWRYTAAVIIAMVATAVRRVLIPYLGTIFPYTIGFPAIIVTTIVLGIGPGLLCVMLMAIGVEVFVIGSFHSIPAHATLLRLGTIMTMGSIVSGIVHATRVAQINARKSEERYRTLFDLNPEAILVHSGGKYVFVNPAAVRLFGAGSQQDIIGRDVLELVHHGDRGDVAQRIEQVYTGALLPLSEMRILRLDGRTVDVDVTAARIEFGRAPAIQMIVRDITERKHMREQIKQSLREKETLLREVHHRVKNNMAVISSLLALQSKKIKEPAVRYLFEESRQRIKSMALVHEKLYQTKDLSAISFKDYITTIAQDILALYGIDGGRVKTEFNLEDIELDLESAVPCGLIINELLTNVFKYSFPDNRSGMLFIGFTKTGDTYALTIKDNGVGLPEGFDYEKTDTLGLQIVNVLSQQISGSFQIKSDNGTEAIVTFTTARK